MNNNDECDIVKDLAIPYTENLINSKSKKFVEEHLKTCKECEKYYSDINSNILSETKNAKIEEKHELDFLKKVRKNMNILKIILICIIIIIGAIIMGVFIKYQIVTKVINNSYDKIEYLKTLDNYKITTKTVSINYAKNDTYEIVSNYYYKNGKYKYNYDVLGNITHIYHNGTLENEYFYDEYNQLIKEHNYILNNTIRYKYDNYGNILFKKTYKLNTYNQLSQNIYEYKNVRWKDQLTKFNDDIIIYDAIGNPLNIGNTVLTWINGRQLASYDDGINQITYKYNIDGIRNRKIIKS